MYIKASRFSHVNILFVKKTEIHLIELEYANLVLNRGEHSPFISQKMAYFIILFKESVYSSISCIVYLTSLK